MHDPCVPALYMAYTTSKACPTDCLTHCKSECPTNQLTDRCEEGVEWPSLGALGGRHVQGGGAADDHGAELLLEGLVALGVRHEGHEDRVGRPTPRRQHVRRQ